MKRFGLVLALLLLGGCGGAPTESKLLGTWQVDLPTPRAISYVFQKDHTCTLTISGQPGALGGTWALEGSTLTITMGSFAAYGMTNAMPAVNGSGSTKHHIAKLTDATMVWRNSLGGSGLKLKRVAVP